ncbi:uncharacterized protein MKK02DRAFT_39947 [Dioszegia hungarica]|uniref:Uncharacterized protein n=1 Tax=Dioszegia hungarica TaxID=4972 RepID=A0AA38HDG5_9TREE|nr:uncharacterized protein MKK02DRAFT_39947 [Dioszegia hungarica]KAI9639623.1 hypothetical protein MKK02DRAFT_39947 [Dioszegia hungarica]
MTNLFDGIAHIVQGIFQSILAAIQGIFHLIYSVFHAVFSLAWGLVENLASFVGSSAHFVFSNIVILGLLALAFFIYQDRQTKARVGGQKKVA